MCYSSVFAGWLKLLGGWSRGMARFRWVQEGGKGYSVDGRKSSQFDGSLYLCHNLSNDYLLFFS